jgi:hypothetical protein
MDRVSKLIMALKSPEYLDHIENLSRNVPNLKKNIEYSRGNVFLEMSMKGKKKAIVFPRYENLSTNLEKLILERDPLYARYRFLRNKIIHTDKVHSAVFSEYDKTIKDLSNIDSEIEVLETYKRIITNETSKDIEDAKNTKTQLLKELEKSDSTIKYLNNLKRIKEVDDKLSNTQSTSVDFYIESMPKIMTIEREDDEEEKEEKKPKKEPTTGEDKECKKPCKEDQICNKKTGRCIKKPKEKETKKRKPKGTTGGGLTSSYEDYDKIKHIVKGQIKNFYINTV